MSLLIRRRLTTAAAQPGPVLPGEYQQVEWLSHTNNLTSYLPIGPYTDVQRVDLDFEKTAVSINAIIPICCVNSNGDNQTFPVGITNNGAGLFVPTQRGYTCSPTAGTEIFTRGLYTFTKLPNAAIGRFFGLFGWTAISFTAPQKVYGVKIYNSSDTLICDGIMCYRKSDSVKGMYDFIAQTFYPVRGTWSAGPDI